MKRRLRRARTRVTFPGGPSDFFAGWGAGETDAEDWVRVDRLDADLCPRVRALIARGERGSAEAAPGQREVPRARESAGGPVRQLHRAAGPLPWCISRLLLLGPPGFLPPCGWGTCLDLMVLGTPGWCVLLPGPGLDGLEACRERA
ncbi:hypothetical protein NDU88_002368 [Pleurodeles waltl]|uniref:Uncharacterized protein n=1 Tax=Pleurodeles waltl TaxID=8319 RepID=A0AAV7NG81_PLEWA|nr:hypothetical protein NDU88_002368 [Pleurodeles waltl]